ncbi:hypothetical protein GCM10009612_07380 [Streptomyces beijiangensis]
MDDDHRESREERDGDPRHPAAPGLPYGVDNHAPPLAPQHAPHGAHETGYAGVPSTGRTRTTFDSARHWQIPPHFVPLFEIDPHGDSAPGDGHGSGPHPLVEEGIRATVVPRLPEVQFWVK